MLSVPSGAKPSTSPLRSRMTQANSSASTRSSSDNNNGDEHPRFSYESSELFEHVCTSDSSDVQILAFTSSSSYDGRRLPSLMGSATSSRGSMVASLTENFIHSGNTAHHRNPLRRLSSHAGSDASTTYVDHIGWERRSIEVDRPDSRTAIKPARGAKRSATGQQNILDTTLGSLSNPLASPNATPAAAAAVAKQNVALSSRKRSVRITDLPTPTKSPTHSQRSGDTVAVAVAAQQHLTNLHLHQHQNQPQHFQDMQMQATQRQQQQQLLLLQRRCLQQQQQQQQQHQQQQQLSQRLAPPPPLNENFANLHPHSHQQQQHRQQLLSSASTPRGALDPPVAVLSPLTTSSSLNETSSTSSPTTPKTVPKQTSTMAKKRKFFFFCSGTKSDVTADNRST